MFDSLMLIPEAVSRRWSVKSLFLKKGFSLKLCKIPRKTSVNSSVIGQRGESQNGDNKKANHAKFSEKRTFLTPWYARDTFSHVRAYHGVRNVCFSENLTCFAFLLLPFWDSPFCLFTDKLSFWGLIFLI